MKLQSPSILKLLFVFFTLSISFNSYAFNGLPEVRKEDGGGNNGECDLNEGGNSTVYFSVVVTDFQNLLDCNFAVGYALYASNYETIDLNNDYTIDEEGKYIMGFKITFPENIITAMCSNKLKSVQIDILCVDEFGNYSNFFGDDTTFDISLSNCCPEIVPIPSGPSHPQHTNDNGKLNTNPSIEETSSLGKQGLKKSNDLDQTSNDFYIYDIHGNFIHALKNTPKGISLKRLITGVQIKNGLYFIKYFKDGQVYTEKVYKN
ncbi:MAG: hypothetical protein P1U56_09530 [Saprospiraceae bacterium]|nr:hypothetical protein [Saprospiraceae bacterium]